MRNIQVIDGAENCTYDIYCIEDDVFHIIFPEGRDIEFFSDLISRLGEEKCSEIMPKLWAVPINKKKVVGIHGTLFFELDYKKKYYPTKKEEEMVIVI
ncbi:hypothetical protein [Gallaecimonas sp. GXIMD4217]|uniref:hypothetical protein n=1 Tax=Gallaecimonas sp. GXIMD4217 TaxID=3131927 RepID=UPI00311AD51B